ncbi:hypothetical protein K0U83_20465 [bacterium]|nr:hypothetical protein [bacterium]
MSDEIKLGTVVTLDQEALFHALWMDATDHGQDPIPSIVEVRVAASCGSVVVFTAESVTVDRAPSDG